LTDRSKGTRRAFRLPNLVHHISFTNWWWTRQSSQYRCTRKTASFSAP